MSLAKTGEIATYCQANAIMTLKEYAQDYARPATREAAQKVIEAEIPKIVHEKIRKASVIRLQKIEEGERDLIFPAKTTNRRIVKLFAGSFFLVPETGKARAHFQLFSANCCGLTRVAETESYV